MKKVVILGLLALLGTASAYVVAEVRGVELAVPYASQVPDGKWVAPWDESCEESSILMVDRFYVQDTSLVVPDTKQPLQDMIDWEKVTFSNYEDTDAEQTIQLIEAKASFRANIKHNPRLEDIKHELDAKRPVIAFVNMYQLYNEPDLGDSFHVFVINGYDEATQEFIVQDPARSWKRYSYERVLNALHDYNPLSKEADGVPTVLFTSRPPEVTPGLMQQFFHWLSELFK